MPVKKTREQVIEDFNKVHDYRYDYSLVSDKISNREKIIVVCPNHGEFKQRPDHHMNGSGCQKCSKNHRYTTEEYITEVKNKYGIYYDYSLVEYINAHRPVKIKCIKHDHIFEINPSRHLLMGSGCPLCYNESRFTSNFDFLLKVNVIHGDRYEYLTEYVRNTEKISIRCKKCNNNFNMKPSKHLLGQGCPKCNESKGEKMVGIFLEKNNIKYEPQKPFVGCVYKRSLLFDFYLPYYNVCIEYDGVQHTKIVKQWDNKETLLDRQIRDKIKTDYCKDNGIRLIRISYKDFKNIDYILEQELIKKTD